MHKKAMTEMQIVWIFILIAGAVILMIFAKIATKQKEAGEAKISTITLSGLGNVFASLSISGDVFHAGELPKAPIKISCEKYSIGDYNRPFGNLIIYSPNLIKGERFLSMSLPWHAPFKASNFLYVTHPGIRYILINKETNPNSDIAKLYDRILKKIPDGLKEESKMEFNGNELGTDKNNYKIRLIYFGGDTSNPPDLPNTKPADITKLDVLSNKDIKFSRKKGDKWDDSGNDLGTSLYLDDEMLIGAIFTEDKETYDCVAGKAFKVLENEAGFKEKRGAKLSAPACDRASLPSQTGDTACKNLHKCATDSMDIIARHAKLSEITTLKNQISALIDYNSYAEKNSCVLIY